MNVVIVGGGIAAAYIANNIIQKQPDTKVQIISKESYMPYDRIHLCALVDESKDVNEISLELNPNIDVVLNQEVIRIDPDRKQIFSRERTFDYDKLIISTGSRPRALFDVENYKNAAVFRSADDCSKIAENIKGRNIVIIGTGPIGLELLETLVHMKDVKSITMLSRGRHLYSLDIDQRSIDFIKEIYEQTGKVRFSFYDEVISHTVAGDEIAEIKTRHLSIDNPFLVFGIGIIPNIDFARGMVKTERGILVDGFMRSSHPDIYAVGEAAQLQDGFIAGHVLDCTNQADTAIGHLVGEDVEAFERAVQIDSLKVGSFYLIDVTAPDYRPSEECESIVIASAKDERIDQYIIKADRVRHFVGINSNVDVGYLQKVIERNEKIDVHFLYESRKISEKGRLICSCVGLYEKELVETIKMNCIEDFAQLKDHSGAGRVCGRCKVMISDIIEQTPIDPEEAARMKREKEEAKRRAELEQVRKKVEKYNRLHPKNTLSVDNLDAAIKAMDLKKDYNRWISMVTASMHLHPEFEGVVSKSVEQLNKIPIVWMELADCTGNSEAFIKSSRPTVEDLIFDYISLDYHDLLMSAAGEQSEAALEEVVKNDVGRYILIVEGAVPLGMDGKFLRLGSSGKTGLEHLKHVAENAAMVIAVGTCAYDGGVVAAAPNPTGAVGVAQALNNPRVINLPGCPVNPTNVVGTLLHYVMFDELPELDEQNRPKWAYGYKIHDNCERRGHYDLDEFVLEWGDEGAKKGWCLFKMGCKGPYSNLNCSLVKFNEGTSWPVQAGHGCFACGEAGCFDKYANEREVVEEEGE